MKSFDINLVELEKFDFNHCLQSQSDFAHTGMGNILSISIYRLIQHGIK